MFDTMNSPNRNMAIVKVVRKQGRSPSKVAQRFGISRQRVYQILNALTPAAPTPSRLALVPRIPIHRQCLTSCVKKSSLSASN